jgi:hypothetical protein
MLTAKLADEVAVEKAKLEELLREIDSAKVTTRDLSKPNRKRVRCLPPYMKKV